MSPNDYHRVVRIPPDLFETIGEWAKRYGTTRPILVAEMLRLLLDTEDGKVLHILMIGEE